MSPANPLCEDEIFLDSDGVPRTQQGIQKKAYLVEAGDYPRGAIKSMTSRDSEMAFHRHIVGCAMSILRL